jgi:hypothetical protein
VAPLERGEAWQQFRPSQLPERLLEASKENKMYGECLLQSGKELTNLLREFFLRIDPANGCGHTKRPCDYVFYGPQTRDDEQQEK